MYHQRDRCFDMYTEDIRRYGLIDRAEELALSERIRNGDEKALEKLITSNLRFVINVSKNFRGQGLSDCELVNEGNIGLVKAAKHYDKSRHDVKFISYAVWWIRQSIITAINKTSRTVQLPVNYGSVIRMVKKERYMREQQMHEPASCQEVCEDIGVRYDYLRQAFEPNQSFDKPVSRRDDSAEFIEVFEDPGQVPADRPAEIDSVRKAIDNMLSELSERDRYIIKESCGIRDSHDDHCATLDEISNQLHMSKERVRQRREKAIKKLRKKIDGEEFRYRELISLS